MPTGQLAPAVVVGPPPDVAVGTVHHVARCLASYGLPGTLLELPSSPLPGDAWDLLLREVVAQRLTGLLQAAVVDEALPATHAQATQSAETTVAAACLTLLLEAELLRLAAILTDADVDFRVLKGSAAAHLDYPVPSQRSFTDVDLLVPGEQFDDVTGLLQRLGYRRRFPEPRPGFDRRFSKGTSFTTPSGVSLDLHRTFVMGPFGLRIQLEDLFGPPRMFTVGGVSLPALDDETRFLHACYHAALGDVVPRLVPQRDVAQLLLGGRLDPDRLRELMDRWGAHPVVARAVRHTWGTLEIADVLALSAWAARYRPGLLQQRELALYSSPDSGYAEKSVAALRAIPGWRDRISFARALAFPRAEYLEGRAHGAARLRKARQALARTKVTE